LGVSLQNKEMKKFIVSGLLIIATLSLIANLQRKSLPSKVNKYPKLLWFIFSILILASLIVSVTPYEWYSARVEIVDVNTSTIVQEKQDEYLNYVFCAQEIQFYNRGKVRTSVSTFWATIKYSEFTATVELFPFSTTQLASFASNDLRNFEISNQLFVDDGLSELPAIVIPTRKLYFIARVHFAYSPKVYEVAGIDSKDFPQNALPLLIQYQFEMADGSKMKTRETPCAYIYAKNGLPLSP
jgi:hypothetical protein